MNFLNNSIKMNTRPPAPKRRRADNRVPELPRSFTSEEVEMCQASPWARLPLELWLLVADHGLCPIDKWHMTLTCRQLQAVFSHPSLWRVFTLLQTFQQNGKPGLTEADRGMVKAFGRHFRSVLVHDWHTCEKELERESWEALETLSLDNQLTEIDVDLRCSDVGYNVSTKSCLLAVIKLLHGAQNLSYLVVRNWPFHFTLLHDKYCLNVMLSQSAINTRRLIPGNLSRCFLNLHDFDLCSQQLSTLAGFFSNFAHIDSLTLRACSLNRDTIVVLTSQRHLGLRELVVLVDDITEYERDILVDEDPIIPESTWRRLKQKFAANCSPPPFCLAVVCQLTHLDAEEFLLHLRRTSTMDRLTVTFLPNDVSVLEEGVSAMSRDSVAVFPSLRHIDLQLLSWMGTAPATLKPKLFVLQTALQRAFGPEACVALTLPQGQQLS